MITWWAAARGAGPARLTYEIGLALLVAAIVAVSALDADTVATVLVVIVTVITTALVPLRLVYPAGAFAAGACASVVAGGQSIAVMVVMGVAAGYRMTHLGRTVAAFVIGLLAVAGALLFEGDFDGGSMILLGALYLMFAVLPAVVARAVARRRSLVNAMHTRNLQLYGQQAAVARQARERERTRIARDLHDSLGHQLTLISLYTGILSTADEKQRAEAVGLLRTTSAAAMSELRQILGILRQEDGDEPGAAQPLSRLDDLLDRARSADADVTLRREGEERPLAPMIEHAAYRVVQEGVTNALRHAHGGAVQVILRYEPDAVIAEVVNTPGVPYSGRTSGQGLIGLAERVRLAGGVLYHGRMPDGRFRIAATLPYRSEVAEVVPVTAPAGDFSVHMDRTARRSRIWLVAVGVGVTAMVGLCSGSLILAETMLTVDEQTYDAATVGQPEESVRATLPDPGNGTASTVDGAACVAYESSFVARLGDDHAGDLSYRFCFADGVLAAKESFYQPGP
ncbi:sensor histidine kinase [Actinoplanes couchii]|uniref:histidine kinase n=1 Tax=Actinoplanes couchii TaxID=403638 RepID=A0ABQ3XEK9_9ACTN|nr:histidine kinase [Actinoplanes couchii]MDR6319792.1 signal transduction histidine kinase [Actinoplanes couchii]GID56927.1 hypothetical protein Aco03nite_053310 [Actinoplanes couchii]